MTSLGQFATWAGIFGTKAHNLDNTGQIAADGLYRVLYMDIVCDTRGQPWYMTLTCLATAASPNQSQLDAGMVSGDF